MRGYANGDIADAICAVQTLGIISLVWLVAQVVVGGGSVWFGGKLFGGGRKAKLLWKYHRCVAMSMTSFSHSPLAAALPFAPSPHTPARLLLSCYHHSCPYTVLTPP